MPLQTAFHVGLFSFRHFFYQNTKDFLNQHHLFHSLSIFVGRPSDTFWKAREKVLDGLEKKVGI
jgi:hypothetical protein